MKTLIRNVSGIFTGSQDIDYTDPGSSVISLDNRDILIDGSIISELPGTRAGHTNTGDYRILDAGGDIVVPGFVDSHTHIMYCGRRTEEFYMRLAGESYSRILEKGGGILSTVRATRECGIESLIGSTLTRLKNALVNGTTTVEIKTGYGLDYPTERKMMDAILKIRNKGLMRIIATALPLHAIPEGSSESEYLDYALETILPELMDDADFVDIFCDKGAFSADSASKLATYLQNKGNKFRMHSGEIQNIGCARLASSFSIRSLDHLIHTDEEDRKAMKDGMSNATFLPVTAFSLGEEFPDARQFIADGIPVSIATDSSPLTMCQNMQFAMHLAVRYCHLTPLEAFIAATINPARSLSIETKTGTVSEGKSADILFLSAENVEEIPYMWNAGLVTKVMYHGNIRYENRLTDES